VTPKEWKCENETCGMILAILGGQRVSNELCVVRAIFIASISMIHIPLPLNE